MDSTWIVMETRIGSRRLWAWCRHEGGSEFAEVRLTERDGMTVAEVDGEEGDEIRLVLDRLVCILPAGEADVGGHGDPLGDLIARDSAVGVIRGVLGRLEADRVAEVIEMASDRKLVPTLELAE